MKYSFPRPGDSRGGEKCQFRLTQSFLKNLEKRKQNFHKFASLSSVTTRGGGGGRTQKPGAGEEKAVMNQADLVLRQQSCPVQ